MNEELTKLIVDNQKLIYSVCSRYPYENQEDLFQVGAIGLIKAYKNFDQTMGAKFTTYAFPYILGEVRKYARENRSVKISREILKLSMEIERYQLLFYQEMERPASVSELSIHFQRSEQDIIQAIYSKNSVQSMDEPIVQDGKEMALHDVIPTKQSKEIESLLDLRNALTNLTEEEQQLIQYRYYNDLSQTEIASMLDMSQVQVSRKEHKVLKKLNHMLN